MRLIRGIPRQPLPPCILTVGTFDGLHRGHQALIARTVALAQAQGLPAAMLTFDPMPREFLNPGDPPARLTNFRERWRLLGASGLQRLHLLEFNARLRALSGSQFLAALRNVGARTLVVGHDFRFGRDGEGNVEWCAREAQHYGFTVEVFAPVRVAGERASSGLVRAALAAGDFGRATQLLGRPYTMRGRVARGAQLGRTLGFPTANLRLQRRRSPLAGIYAVRVSGGLAGEAPAGHGRPAVASLGTRPTVNGVEPLLEVHLFDFAGDLYGAELQVEFVAHLRAELRFDDLDALVAQMQRDADAARALLR